MSINMTVRCEVIFTGDQMSQNLVSSPVTPDMGNQMFMFKYFAFFQWTFITPYMQRI
jgi:hypothetical protein